MPALDIAQSYPINWYKIAVDVAPAAMVNTPSAGPSASTMPAGLFRVARIPKAAVFGRYTPCKRPGRVPLMLLGGRCVLSSVSFWHLASDNHFNCESGSIEAKLCLGMIQLLRSRF
jgi:hypothetical protein